MGSKLLGSSAVAAAGGGLVGGRGGVQKAGGGVGTLPTNGHKDIFQVRGLRTPMCALAQGEREKLCVCESRAHTHTPPT